MIILKRGVIMKDLLVVVDMVNGFVERGALADKNIGKITPTILNMIQDAKDSGFELLAFKDCHTIGDEEFNIYPVHCLKGSTESDFIPEIKQIARCFDYIIDKNTTNGFDTKEFRDLISKNRYNNIFVCGCCTDICVQNFVESLAKYFEKNNLHTNIHVVGNACYTFDGPNHNAEQCHSKALETMYNIGVNVIDYPTREHEKECEEITLL